MRSVFTPSEAAQYLKIPEDQVARLIEEGELKAFRAGLHIRITEEALLDLTNRPYPPKNSANQQDASHGNPRTKPRNRNPELERKGRDWALGQVGAATGLDVERTRRSFAVNGRQGIMGVSTTISGPQGQYWFGFNKELLLSNDPIFVMPVLADKEIAFVIPYAQHTSLFDGLSEDNQGNKKFNIEERSGHFFLSGKNVDPPLPLDPYKNDFERFNG